MNIILAIIFGLSRAAHGGGYVGRLLSVWAMALALFGVELLRGEGVIDASVSGIIGFAGLYLGLLLGWGKGLAAVSGRYYPQEKDFWPADKVGDYVFAKTGNGFKAGVAFMTVRAVMLYPVFIALALWQGEPLLYLTGLSVFSMGAVYYLAGKYAGEAIGVRVAELVYFAIIGAALI